MTQSGDSLWFVDVTEARLQTAFGWEHDLGYNLEDENIENKCVLLETSRIKSIWQAYHYVGNKSPGWCCEISDIVRYFDNKRWKTNLDGDEPESSIVAFLKTSVLTRADNERLIIMRESTNDEGDCDSIESDDQNPFA